MNRLIAALMFMLTATLAEATDYFGKALCDYPEFTCIVVGHGQSWNSLFPNPVAQDVVQRLNRSYNSLWPGKIIVVPKDLTHKTLFDISPFALNIAPIGEKQIIVDQEKLAWAAYNASGKLVLWGPLSSGKDLCGDIRGSCRTLTGIYRVFSKEGVRCRSKIFPVGKGGAKMPYCMYFHKGFALHGSDDMPGVRASHGCVRIFTRDAKWLNDNFAVSSNESNGFLGTIVTVRPLNSILKIKERKL